MKVQVKLNYLRIAPRKVRLVADLIRRKKAKEAQQILNFTVKRAARPILKLLNLAIASAKNDFQLDSDNLYVSKITVDEGPKLKRWMPRARGRTMEIQKKTSHITLALDEIKPTENKRPVKKSKENLKKEEAKKSDKKINSVKTKENEKKELGIKEKTKRLIKEFKGTAKPGEWKGTRKIFRRKSF